MAAAERSPKIAEQLSRRAWAFGRRWGNPDAGAGLARTCKTGAARAAGRRICARRPPAVPDAGPRAPQPTARAGASAELGTRLRRCRRSPATAGSSLTSHLRIPALRSRRRRDGAASIGWWACSRASKPRGPRFIAKRLRPHKRSPGRVVFEEIPGVAAFYKLELAGTGNALTAVRCITGPTCTRAILRRRAWRLARRGARGLRPRRVGRVSRRAEKRPRGLPALTGRELQKLEFKRPAVFRAAGDGGPVALRG